jgi:hypothetical protein
VHFGEIDLGGTYDGCRIVREATYVELRCDQAPGALDKKFVDGKYTITLNMAQTTLEKLYVAWDMPSSNLVSSSLNLDADDGTLTSLEIVGTFGDGNTYTAHFWKVRAVGTGEINHVKDGQLIIPVTFEGFWDTDVNSWGFIKETAA